MSLLPTQANGKSTEIRAPRNKARKKKPSKKLLEQPENAGITPATRDNVSKKVSAKTSAKAKSKKKTRTEAKGNAARPVGEPPSSGKRPAAEAAEGSKAESTAKDEALVADSSKGGTSGIAASSPTPSEAAGTQPQGSRPLQLTSVVRPYSEAQQGTDAYVAWALHCWISTGKRSKAKGELNPSDMTPFYQLDASFKQKVGKPTAFVLRHPGLFELDANTKVIQALPVSRELPLSQALGSRQSAKSAARPAPSAKGDRSSQGQQLMPWATTPNVPPGAVAALQDAHLKVQLSPFEALQQADDKRLEGTLKGLIKNKNLRTFLVRERIKRLAEDGIEELWRRVDEEPTLRQDLLDNPGTLPNIAREYNVTTTDLARLMAGKDCFKAAIEEHVDSEARRAEDSSAVRRVQEAIAARDSDHYTAYRLQTRDYSLKPAAMSDSANRAEETLYRQLRQAGLAFLTEEQQMPAEYAEKVGTERCVPDARFETPTLINGHKVNWIDAKGGLCVPGLSPKSMFVSLQHQIARYTERFGPGAIYWHKGFFTECLKDQCNNATHFRPDVPLAQQKKAPKKPARRSAPPRAESRSRKMSYGLSREAALTAGYLEGVTMPAMSGRYVEYDRYVPRRDVGAAVGSTPLEDVDTFTAGVEQWDRVGTPEEGWPSQPWDGPVTALKLRCQGGSLDTLEVTIPSGATVGHMTALLCEAVAKGGEAGRRFAILHGYPPQRLGNTPEQHARTVTEAGLDKERLLITFQE